MKILKDAQNSCFSTLKHQFICEYGLFDMEPGQKHILHYTASKKCILYYLLPSQPYVFILLVTLAYLPLAHWNQETLPKQQVLEGQWRRKNSPSWKCTALGRLLQWGNQEHAAPSHEKVSLGTQKLAFQTTVPTEVRCPDHRPPQTASQRVPWRSISVAFPPSQWHVHTLSNNTWS